MIILKVMIAALLAAQGAPGREPAAEAPVATGTACGAPAVAIDFALKASIDPLIDAAVKDGFAGQVAIIKDGSLVYETSVGSADLAGAVAVTPTTLHHVASITKEVTAPSQSKPRTKKQNRGKTAHPRTEEELVAWLAAEPKGEVLVTEEHWNKWRDPALAGLVVKESSRIGSGEVFLVGRP